MVCPFDFAYNLTVNSANSSLVIACCILLESSNSSLARSSSNIALTKDSAQEEGVAKTFESIPNKMTPTKVTIKMRLLLINIMIHPFCFILTSIISED